MQMIVRRGLALAAGSAGGNVIGRPGGCGATANTKAPTSGSQPSAGSPVKNLVLAQGCLPGYSRQSRSSPAVHERSPTMGD